MDKLEFTTISMDDESSGYVTAPLESFKGQIPSTMQNIWPDEFILNTDQHTLAVF